MADLLKQAVNGRLVLIIPMYCQALTTLEYEEAVKALREPYTALVNQGLLCFESRHSTVETYRLTSKAVDMQKYYATLPKAKI